MASNRRYAMIGMFVIGALLIASIGIALVSGVGLGRTKVQALMVFRGNVNGLEVGTPVNFRGMKIGEVRRVRTIYEPDTKHVVFPVYAEFTGTIEVPGYDNKSTDGIRRAWLVEMIGRGLRAQLQTKSFVTGQQMIMLDFQPDVEASYAKIDPSLLEIPTALSSNEAMLDALKELPVRQIAFEGQRLISQLNGLLGDKDGKPGALTLLLQQLNDTSGALKAAVPALNDEAAQSLRELRRTLQSGRVAVEAIGKAGKTLDSQVARSADSLAATLGDVSNASTELQRAAGKSGQSIDQTLGRLNESLERLDRSMARIEYSLSEDAPLTAGLSNSLLEVRSAAQSLRQTADSLNRRPDSLLFGHRAQTQDNSR